MNPRENPLRRVRKLGVYGHVSRKARKVSKQGRISDRCKGILDLLFKSVQPEESYVKSNPRVEMANTFVRPWRSPKAPHQPEVSADRNPIVTVMIVCS